MTAGKMEATARGIGARVRYYLHGDAQDGDASAFYCQRCDLFADAAHFPPCAARSRASDADLIERGRAAMRGESVPVFLVMTAEYPKRAARDYGAMRRARYWRPANARTVWNAP